MRFLLVMPRFVSPDRRHYEFPLGIAYVSAALKRAGHEVRCLNLNQHDAPVAETVGAAVRDFDPVICGSGGLSPHVKGLAEVFAAARATKPAILNLVGGGVFSADPEKVAGKLDVDLGVIGEGEETVVELAAALESGASFREVAGLARRDDSGRMVRGPSRKPIGDLGTVAWPDLDGFGLAAYLEGQRSSDNYLFHLEDRPRAVPMIASRSCPYACTFCFHPIGRVYRERPLDDFFAELETHIERHGVNLVAIHDELFAVKRERLVHFCERIRRYPVRWTAQLHVEVVDEEIITWMKEAGCVCISYGLESVDDGVLRSMRKKTTGRQVVRALDLAWKRRVGIQGNFLFGDPADTLDNMNRTLDWWARHRHFHVNLVGVQVYPGSPLHREAEAKGLLGGAGPCADDAQVNLTALDPATFALARQKLVLWQETVFVPARNVTFDPETAGDGYRVTWECPRCGHRNLYRHVRTDQAEEFQALRLTCRGCLARFQVPNLARQIWIDPELEDAHEAAARRCAEGDTVAAAVAYQRILDRSFGGQRFDRPRAFIRAAFDLGNLVLETGRFPQKAVWNLGQALFRSAFDPACHLAFAKALLAEGCPSAALMHFEQVLLLAGDEAGTAVDGLAPTVERLRTAVAEPRYFALAR
jgi:radical SAM superfamily enzyme YgiQ (UPF0313 family)